MIRLGIGFRIKEVQPLCSKGNFSGEWVPPIASLNPLWLAFYHQPDYYHACYRQASPVVSAGGKEHIGHGS